MKRIKRIKLNGVTVHIPVFDTLSRVAYCMEMYEKLINENCKLRFENEALKMQLVSLQLKMKDHGFC